MANTDHKNRFFKGAGAMNLLEKHYDSLPDEDRKELVMDLIFAAKELMVIRNIINSAINHERPAVDCTRDMIEDYVSSGTDER